MPLWTKTDSATGGPKFRVTDKFVTATSAGGSSNGYANITPSAFVNNQVLGVAALDGAEASALTPHPTHPGWLVYKYGTGPVLSITMGGTTPAGYSNLDVVTVSNGVINATATVVTNATGGSLVMTLTNPGRGFINATAVTVAIANSIGGSANGSNATFTVTLGGRAGRRQHEVLVAMNSIASNGSTLLT